MDGSSSAAELFPDRFARPSSVIVSGSSRTLLKWFAFASLAPYSSRLYWTDVRLPGEIMDPLDPMVLHAIPEETVYVLTPRDLLPDDLGAQQAEAAAATMIHSDDRANTMQGLVEFLRMPVHGQRLISATGRPDLPSVLVTANTQRLATVYAEHHLAPLIRAMLASGTCQVALWAEAPTSLFSLFDVVLQLEGSDPRSWPDATVRCERGIATGPLASGSAVRLSSLPAVSAVLEKWIPQRP
jgi:hypothetical protein